MRAQSPPETGGQESGQEGGQEGGLKWIKEMMPFVGTATTLEALNKVMMPFVGWPED